MNKWQKIKLSDVCDVRDGTHDTPIEVSNGKYLVTSKHIKGGKIDLSSAYKISLEDFNSVNQRSKVDQWDILISMIGTVGEICIVSDVPDFAIKNVGLIKTGNEYLAKYLYYYLKSPTAQNDILARLKGTTQQYLSLGEIRNFPVIIPPLDVQKKIAGVLGALDDKIELNNKINNNLEQQAQALFKSWFVDFEPFGGKMPDDWKVGKLGEIAEITSGKRPLEKQNNINNEFYIPLVGASCIMGYTNSSLYSKRILITGRVGTHGIVQRFNKACWPSDNTLVIISKYYEYCYQILKTINYTAMNRGSTQPLITQTDLKNAEIIVPENKILTDFEKNVETLMNLCESNQRENTRLAQLRDALLPKLMSGEIDVSKVNISADKLSFTED